MGNGSEASVNKEDGDDIHRWTAKRKAAVVLDLIRGVATAADVARQYGLTVAEVDAWRDRFLEAGEEGMRVQPREVEARHDAEKKDLMAKIGELTLEVDVLKKAYRTAGKGASTGISS